MQQQMYVFCSIGNYIIISDYNISVLTMKVIHQFQFFLQNTTKLTTNKTEFFQSLNTTILGKVDLKDYGHNGLKSHHHAQVNIHQVQY